MYIRATTMKRGHESEGEQGRGYGTAGKEERGGINVVTLL